MAENSSIDKPATDAALPPPPSNDWELLSMTSSMLGPSKSNLDIMPAPHELAQNSEPAEFGHGNEPQNSERSYGFIDDTAAAAQPPARHVDPASSTSSITEPFTDGWKPHQSVGLFFEENRPEAYSGKEALPNDRLHQVTVEESDPLLFPDKDVVMATGQKDMGMGTDKHVQAAGEDVPVVVSVSPHPLDKTLQQDKRSKGRGKRSRWRSRAGLWIPESPKSSTLWSVAAAAAIFGIVFMGHRWYQEWRRNQQLQIKLSEKDEEIHDLTKRMREAFTGRRKLAGTKSWW